MPNSAFDMCYIPLSNSFQNRYRYRCTSRSVESPKLGKVEAECGNTVSIVADFHLNLHRPVYIEGKFNKGHVSNSCCINPSATHRILEQ